MASSALIEIGSSELDRIRTLAQELAIPEYDLACVGTSIQGLGAFSLDALACLACADIVYYYPPSGRHLEFVKRINANVIDVNATLYVPGAPFEPTYRAIVAQVMGSLRKGRRVAYAVQGSPAFHCGTAVQLYRLARQRGLAAIMVCGISSLELLTAELSEFHDLSDLQVYGMRHIASGASIDPTVPCLLFDLGRFALPAVRGSAKSLLHSRLEKLQTRLGMIYPQDHQLLLMCIANDGTCRSRKTRLRDLSASLILSGPSVTIFIQALAYGEARNELATR